MFEKKVFATPTTGDSHGGLTFWYTVYFFLSKSSNFSMAWIYAYNCIYVGYTLLCGPDHLKLNKKNRWKRIISRQGNLFFFTLFLLTLYYCKKDKERKTKQVKNNSTRFFLSYFKCIFFFLNFFPCWWFAIVKVNKPKVKKKHHFLINL